MNILFPIAGLGTRFKSDGYVDPKPFIEFNGKPILEWAISSLNIQGKYYVIVNNLPEKYIKIINNIKQKYYLDLHVVDIKQFTRGQAETCLLGIEKCNIDLNDELIITNCDQFTPWNVNKFINFIKENDCDGIVSTYDHDDFIINEPSPYSHIEIDDEGYAIKLTEKFASSNLALNGIFYWKTSSLFVSSTKEMLEDSSEESWGSGKYSYNKEKYVAVSYNYLIKKGYKIKNYHMMKNEFISLGSPKEIYVNLMRNNVNQAVEDLCNGKPIVMVDDYDREFEGDIVIAAEKATRENILFAMRHAKGLMCLPCLQEKLDQFNIPMMNSNGMDEYGTPFATSIDAVDNATTGMSVDDRLQTIKTFLSDVTSPTSLSQPGHMFPLRAKPGLLKDRRGHTEGCIEILKYAGLSPVGIIIEIMDEDGNMLKGEKLKAFSKIYNLTFISIQELYDVVYNKNSSMVKTPLSSLNEEQLNSMVNK